ncbi:class I SAM-dependent methyltransferase [Roseomonas fluvialis]|uniref:Class I SAM-dependent methyltransferase n=1 Tax=Roseomonas fluvialis TaxID=1750527 RepID=A0ABN6P4H4_9PROT|nr:class I SAM-dependent methyltransferase [Roseomonas fluvialis]BDG72818.1 hypothetical protein Rmf_27470 [Roseomonas fluvialis]
MPDKKWYPDSLKVGAQGTSSTYRFLESIYKKHDEFSYAEFGVYRGDTARNVAERFPNATLHLFDYQETIDEAIIKLSKYQNKIFYYGNSQKYHDSYNWHLGKILKNNPHTTIFDYCFLDGAHTFSIDALTYFLCDMLLKRGGHIDFDDYAWRLRGSSLDPRKVPSIAEQYTDEQIDAYQVKMIVDNIVRPSGKYREVVKNKIFQKL